MKQKSKVREYSEYAKSACISMVFPFGALAPDGRESGHQWHSRGQRFDPAYLHQKAPKSFDFGAFRLSKKPRRVCARRRKYSSKHFCRRHVRRQKYLSARKRASVASALRRAAAFSNESPAKRVSFESVSKILFDTLKAPKSFDFGAFLILLKEARAFCFRFIKLPDGYEGQYSRRSWR